MITGWEEAARFAEYREFFECWDRDEKRVFAQAVENMLDDKSDQYKEHYEPRPLPPIHRSDDCGTSSNFALGIAMGAAASFGLNCW